MSKPTQEEVLHHLVMLLHERKLLNYDCPHCRAAVLATGYGDTGLATQKQRAAEGKKP